MDLHGFDISVWVKENYLFDYLGIGRLVFSLKDKMFWESESDGDEVI